MDTTGQSDVAGAVPAQSAAVQPLHFQPIQFVQPQSIPPQSEFRLVKSRVVPPGRKGKLGFLPNHYSHSQIQKALRLRGHGLTYSLTANSISPNCSVTTVHRWERIGLVEFRRRYQRHLRELRHLREVRRRPQQRRRMAQLPNFLPPPGPARLDLYRREIFAGLG